MTTRTCLSKAAKQASRFSVVSARRTSRNIPPTVRRFAAEATSSASSSSSPYESPFKEFFDMIKQGKTSLGTNTLEPAEEEEVRYLKCGVREDVLRFKTVHYGRQLLPPHVQPGEHTVTLKVFLSDLNLNEVELEVLRQIVTSRISEKRNELRLSSDQFGSRIENKRHLVSMLDRLVMASKQLAQDYASDTTEQTQQEA